MHDKDVFTVSWLCAFVLGASEWDGVCGSGASRDWGSASQGPAHARRSAYLFRHTLEPDHMDASFTWEEQTLPYVW